MVQVLRSCIYSPLKPGVPKPFSLGRPKLKLHWQAYKDLLYCLCSTVLMQNGTRVLIYRNWPCYSLHKKGLCRRTHRGPQWKEQKAQTYVKRGQIWKTQGIKSGNTGNTRAPGRHKEWGEKPQAQIHRNHQLTEHRKQEINQTNNPNPDRPREDVGPMRVSLAYFCRNSNVLTRWRPRLRPVPSPHSHLLLSLQIRNIVPAGFTSLVRADRFNILPFEMIFASCLHVFPFSDIVSSCHYKQRYATIHPEVLAWITAVYDSPGAVLITYPVNGTKYLTRAVLLSAFLRFSCPLPAPPLSPLLFPFLSVNLHRV